MFREVRLVFFFFPMNKTVPSEQSPYYVFADQLDSARAHSISLSSQA